MKDLANDFRSSRTRLGWSQRTLAEKASIVHCTVCRFENGKQDITIETALKIAKALGDKSLIQKIMQKIKELY